MTSKCDFFLINGMVTSFDSGQCYAVDWPIEMLGSCDRYTQAEVTAKSSSLHVAATSIRSKPDPNSLKT